MISLHTHREPVEPRSEHYESVDVCVAADGDCVMRGTLVMRHVEAAELAARIDAGELSLKQPITPEIAAQVLWHYDATGGMEPGGFKQALIITLDKADRENVLRLSAVYPGYALAVHWAKNTEDGIARLQDIAGRRLITPEAVDATS